MGLCAALQAASDCGIEEYTATWLFRVSDTRPAPGGAPTDQGAIFIFSTNVPGEYLLIDVPSVPLSCIGDNGLIDITQPAIANLAVNIIDQGWCNPFGSVATALLSAVPTVTP
jgi:hypothetical protein